MPKVLARCLYNQLYPFFDKIPSIQQCRFGKGFNAQLCIIRLKGEWKQCLYQGLMFAVFLTDLLKALGCLSHKLLAAKLNVYGLQTSTI